jgi:hypothetical protein
VRNRVELVTFRTAEMKSEYANHVHSDRDRGKYLKVSTMLLVASGFIAVHLAHL